MKFRFLTTICIAGAALSVSAQGYKDGIEYYKADRYESARELLERNINNADTDKSSSYYYLGMIADHNKNLTGAKKYFEDGKNANEANPYNYVGLGLLELKNASSKNAETYFKEAEKLGKKDAGVQVAIARAYYEVNPNLYAKEIDKRIEKARKINSNNPDIYIFEGDRAFDRKSWGDAAGMFEMAASFAPQAAEAYVKNADVHEDVNLNYAIQQLQNLLSANPNSALGQKELAEMYYRHGQYKEAAQQYGKYVVNPNHFKNDEDRYSFLLFYGGDYQKGYNYATQLLNKNPNNFTAMSYQFINAAQLPDLSDQWLSMAENLYTAHKSDSKNVFAPIVYTLVADEFGKAKRYDEAIEVLDEAIATYPTNAQFESSKANMYINTGDYDKAADTYKNYVAKKSEPGYSDYIQVAILAYYGGGKNTTSNQQEAKRLFNEAIEYAQKAEAKDNNQYYPNKLYGDVKIANADSNSTGSVAVSDYQTAISKFEKLESPSKKAINDAKTMYNYVGNYYLDKKDKASALKYFEKYLKYDPENQDYTRFVNGLK
jgi:tetratricopeptide (TPR) repeat protein